MKIKRPKPRGLYYSDKETCKRVASLGGKARSEKFGKKKNLITDKQ